MRRPVGTVELGVHPRTITGVTLVRGQPRQHLAEHVVESTPKFGIDRLL
jgi:hypothetical protein